ncbi:hypothetical protein IQ07DRAFT_594504 [Pyrenochaeta sp. DS3sAY3a]|nr:hypothetical protein IQ07DRAFT_594504 [Pyrenochaeta sp. DS3sAY3a]
MPPWLPKGERPTLLAVVPWEKWYGWADGDDFGPPPHLEPPSIFACMCNRNFVDPDGVRYKKGMQGQLLHVNENGMAKIFIRGVTEGPGFTNRWVPVEFIDKGKPWESDINKWEIKIHLGKTPFDTTAWNVNILPDTTVLRRTIMLFISALQNSPPPFAAGKLKNFLDRSDVATLTQIIIRGIKDAGLYTILSSGKPFSAQDLIKESKCQIRHSTSSNIAGVYARFHKSTDAVENWKPGESYVYVGKTVDFGARFSSHRYATSNYGELTRNSEVLMMIALCILPGATEEGLFYLVEQIFLCLLQTYKEELIQTDRTNPSMLSFYQSAEFFIDLSNEVFKTTNWQGGVARGESSFGIKYGANCSTPLLEYSDSFERLLFVRTDADVRDCETGSVVPMAFYRRANRVIAPQLDTSFDRKDQNGKPIIPVLNVFGKRTIDEKSVVWFGFRYEKSMDGKDLPLPGTPYELVFEVRRDGSPHPNAWARLPEIGRWNNLGQANSFAVRIEWQHPPESGKWRFTYCQVGNIYRLHKAPGSFVNYGKAISFLRWLTGSKTNNFAPWIPQLSGSARVLQTEYDFMNQTVTFHGNQNPPIRMLSGHSRSPNAIKTLMRLPKYGLENVDGAFGRFTFSSTIKHRKTCDLCFLIVSKQKGSLPDNTCIKQKNGNGRICTNCAAWGLPCCSWTGSLRSERDHQTWPLFPEDMARIRTVRAALASLPVAEISEHLQSFSQDLRALQDSGNTELDDGSDCEEEVEEYVESAEEDE